MAWSKRALRGNILVTAIYFFAIWYISSYT